MMPKLIKTAEDWFALGEGKHRKQIRDFELCRNREEGGRESKKRCPVIYRGARKEISITKIQIEKLIKWLQQSIGE